MRLRRLASVPVVSSLEAGMKVADPLGLLGPEEGGGDAVPQAAGVGLQEDRGASRELQGACSQGRGCVRALGGQQRAAWGSEAQLPLAGFRRKAPTGLAIAARCLFLMFVTA